MRYTLKQNSTCQSMRRHFPHHSLRHRQTLVAHQRSAGQARSLFGKYIFQTIIAYSSWRIESQCDCLMGQHKCRIGIALDRSYPTDGCGSTRQPSKAALHVVRAFVAHVMVGIRTRQDQAVVHRFLSGTHACHCAKRAVHSGSLFGWDAVSRMSVWLSNAPA